MDPIHRQQSIGPTSLHSYKSRQSAQQSLASQQTDASNASFHELVTIDHEGHPYIDINRLIYKPTPYHLEHQHDKVYRKERLSWYIPDFSFIVFNLIGLGVSTYFCLIGVSTLTWKASIGMFSVPQCNLTNGDGGKLNNTAIPSGFYYRPCKKFMEPGEYFTEESNGYNWNIQNNFPILRTKLVDVQYFGLVLICIELLNLINVIVGINACLQGYKVILIQHIALDGLIIMAEFVISAVVTFTSTCEVRDLRAIRVVMENFIRWYGTIINSLETESDKEKLINDEIDALQIGLGCCGADGWADYLAAAYPNSDWSQSTQQLDNADMVIPFSCCRSWWIRNVYCSHGVHNWAHPMASKEQVLKFQERIVPEGCIYKLEKLCLNLREWMGGYGFVATLLHFFCIIFEAIGALILIRNINTLIREKKKMERHKEMFHDDAGSEMDSGNMSRKSVTSGRSQWSKVPPPTEDEVLMIKQRSNFNHFMSRVKGGFVGRWMNEAHMLVTEGHAPQEEEDITAEEKKQREKELLHGKPKQVQRVQNQEQEPTNKAKPGGKTHKKAIRFVPSDSKKVVSKKIEHEHVGEPEATVIHEYETLITEGHHHKKPHEHDDKKLDIGSSVPETRNSRKSFGIKLKKTKKLHKQKKAKGKKKQAHGETVDEPPPLTESGVSTPVDEGRSEIKSASRRRKRRRKKRRGERPPWQGSYFW